MIFTRLFLLLLLASFAQAQWRIEPLIYSEKTSKNPSSAKVEALSLPFFDDFSLAKNNQPDPVLWQNGGTRVGNTLALSHPSINVVSFDGAKSNGQPYNFENEFAYGPADTLTSQPIDLAKYTPADSLYLSFFWQARGLGELPDETDSLVVQFLTNGNLWRTVWSQKGLVLNNGFTQVLLPVRAAVYMHGGFQFRFRAYGRESGNFDTWHIDYVYLNAKRRFNDRFVKDIATRRNPSPLFRNFWAVPLSHFKVDPIVALADSAKTDISNLFNNNNFTSFRFIITEQSTGRVLQDFTDTAPNSILPLGSQEKRAKINLTNAIGTAKTVLKYKFDILTSDDQNPSIPGINLRRNDTISAFAPLNNYYAYDDGTAEYAASINARLGKVANRFVLIKPDTLTGIQINFAATRRDLTGTPVVLQVLSSKNGKPDKILYQRSTKVEYTTLNNGFVEIPFDEPVAVKDTCFVGYFQITEESIAVGLDKNTPQFAGNIFYNAGLDWQRNTEVKGSVMIRPVIGGNLVKKLLAVEKTAQTADIQVYPNPTTGLVRWSDSRFTHWHITDLSGQTLLQNTTPTAEADLSALKAGLYLLRLSDGETVVVKKVILR